MSTEDKAVEVMVGDVWEDLDKRTNGRRVKVIEVIGGKHAIVQRTPGGGPTNKIAIVRMRSSKTGGSGFRLVERVNMVAVDIETTGQDPFQVSE